MMPDGYCKVIGARNSELEYHHYIESEDLNGVKDVDSSLKTLLMALDSKDWVLVCEALNDVRRRVSIFHKEAIVDMLGKVISLIVKSLKNPRSAVCGTAIMASVDIFKAYHDSMSESVDPLGLRPELPTNAHPRMLDLMQRCWEAIPSDRPSFS